MSERTEIIELNVYPKDLGELDLEKTGTVLAVAGAAVTHLLAENAGVDVTREDPKIIKRVLNDYNGGNDSNKARMVGAFLLNVKKNYGLIHPNLDSDPLKCDPDDYLARYCDIVEKISNLGLTTNVSVAEQAARWIVFGKFTSVTEKEILSGQVNPWSQESL